MTDLFDQDVADDDEYVDLPHESTWMRRGLVVLLVLLALVLVVGLVGAWWLKREIDPPGAPGAVVQIDIPSGSSTQAIGSLLERRDVITDAGVWRWYIKLKSAGPFQAGRYRFRVNSSMGDAIEVLNGGPLAPPFKMVTVPEGYTVDQIVSRLTDPDRGVKRYTKERLQAALTSGQIRSAYQPDGVNTLEGLLYPSTYRIEEKQDEAATVREMVTQTDDVARSLGYDQSQQLVHLTPYQTIIVASLVEREARVPGDRAKIARVIYNRLAKGMKLEVDATVLYALGSHKQVVLNKDLEVDSPYNTYKRTGLPPTPIASPGKASLDAALHPADGPWLFYVVTGKDGSHSFATTFAEHQANIRKAQENGVR